MARLQILELPEGSGDDRPPFILVVDQADEATVNALSPSNEGLSSHSAVMQKLTGQTAAEQIGARGILVFADTIDIPANEVPVGPDGYPLKIRIEGDFETFREQVQDEIRKAQVELRDVINNDGIAEFSGPKCQYCGANCSDGRSWDGGDLYACPSCADWRAKLNHHRAELLDALGMDRLRDWDDIRNAARGLRKKTEDLAAKIERVLRLPETPQQGVGAEAFDYLNGYRDATRAALSALVNPADDQSPSDA